MSKAANKTSLEELHNLLAAEMRKLLMEGETHVTKDGEVVKTSLSGATLGQIRQFLKDNNIEAPHGGTDEMNKLAGTITRLPFGADPRDLQK